MRATTTDWQIGVMRVRLARLEAAAESVRDELLRVRWLTSVLAEKLAAKLDEALEDGDEV